MLSGAHPTVKYKHSSILTVAYGKQPDGGIALGSLDLLDPQRKLHITAVTAKAAEGMGEAEKETWSALPHASFDLVIMNPPFTRPTGHEGKKSAFLIQCLLPYVPLRRAALDGQGHKAFDRGNERARQCRRGINFFGACRWNQKQGGTLALVMPLSLMAGDAWEN